MSPSRALVCLFGLVALAGCTNSSSTTTTTTAATTLAPEDKILFTGISPHFADSLIMHASRADFMAKVRKGWDVSKLAFPAYSRTLANLAQWMSRYEGAPLTPASLERLSSQWGITTPWIIQTYMKSRATSDAAEVAWVRAQLGRYSETHHISHYGLFLGKKGKERLVVLLMQRRMLELAPFPKWVQVGESAVLFGKAEVPLSGLEVVITRPDQKVERRFVNLSREGTFKLAMKFCGKARYMGGYRTDFIGYNREGPVALARFVLACGRKSMEKLVEPVLQNTPRAPISTVDFEDQVMSRVNQYRKKMGFLPLTWHKGISKAARDHAGEMCEKLRLMHVSPTTGNPQERLKAAGVEGVDTVAENVGTGDLPGPILEAWIASPDHRANLQLAAATHGAVGVCRRELVDKSTVYYAALMLVSFEAAARR